MKKSFIPDKPKTSWQPWFVQDKPIEGEVKVKFPGIPDIDVDVPRVGVPKSFPPLVWDEDEDETQQGSAPPQTQAGGGVPSSSPPPKIQVIEEKVSSLKKKIVTGDKTRGGKDIVVTYYPPPNERLKCSCSDFVLNDTCKHIIDSEIMTTQLPEISAQTKVISLMIRPESVGKS